MEIFEKKKTLDFNSTGEETKILRSGKCNAENYPPRIAKYCKVDAHLKQLESLSDNVNKCALYLIQEIELKLPANFINYREIIKLTLRGNYEDRA